VNHLFTIMGTAYRELTSAPPGQNAQGAPDHRDRIDLGVLAGCQPTMNGTLMTLSVSNTEYFGTPVKVGQIR
jgi:hypothetical protein